MAREHGKHPLHGRQTPLKASIKPSTSIPSSDNPLLARTSADVLRLQRTVGNRTVQRFLQPKLNPTPTDDFSERESDQGTSHVVSRILNKNQRFSLPAADNPQTSRHSPLQREEIENDPNLSHKGQWSAYEWSHAAQATPIQRKLSTSSSQSQVLQRLFGIGKKKFKRLPEVMSKNYVDASSSGAIGVFFLSDHAPDGSGNKGNTVVVKFEPGDASNTLFAEQFLGGLGISTANSQMTPMTTKQGKAIYNKVGSLIKSGKINAAKAAAINTKYGNGASALTVVVADFIGGETMADMAKNTTSGATKKGYNRSDMAEALMDPSVAFDLGRLMAFDAVLGNGDRLKSAVTFSNVGNFMFRPKGGGRWQVVAIDNMTDAPTLEAAATQKLPRTIDDAQGTFKPGDYGASGKITATVTTTINADYMASKAYLGYSNQMGLLTAGMGYLMDTPDLCAEYVTNNLKAGVAATMHDQASAIDAQVNNTIDWNAVEYYFQQGLQRAAVQLQELGTKRLQKHYNDTKSQTGKVSNEVSIPYLRLKLKTIEIWAQGNATRTDIEKELQQEAKRLYKDKQGSAGSKVEFSKNGSNRRL